MLQTRNNTTAENCTVAHLTACHNPTGALGEEPVRELYPELLKRLDDSNDSVRKAVCATLAAFFRATPPENVKGTVLDYSSDQLLVHLDDQDPAVQVRY
jgi:HEAT-like repeat